jgi:hypothetical protein
MTYVQKCLKVSQSVSTKVSQSVSKCLKVSQQKYLKVSQSVSKCLNKNITENPGIIHIYTRMYVYICMYLYIYIYICMCIHTYIDIERCIFERCLERDILVQAALGRHNFEGCLGDIYF